MLASYLYGYDADGRVIAQTIDGVPTTYGYDAAGQLTSAGASLYGFDANGNRDTGSNAVAGQPVGLGRHLDVQLRCQQQPHQEEPGRQCLDVDLRLRRAEPHDLAQQRATDGGTLLLEETFAYDALGNRIQQQTWTSSTGWVASNFAYDGQNVFADLDGSNALQTRYVRPNGVDALGARIVGGVVSWFNTDRQGSLRLITSGTGSVLDAIDYDAFGKKISEKRSGGGFAVRLHGSGRGQQPGPAIQPGAGTTR